MSACHAPLEDAQDRPQLCPTCGELIPCELSWEGQRYVEELRAEFIRTGAGETTILCALEDSYADLQASRDCYAAIGGSKTTGTLQLADLLDAALNTAAEYLDWTPDAHLREVRERTVLQPLALTATSYERAYWTLEHLEDAIDRALPKFLYYGCAEGNSSDIGVFPC